MGDLVGHVVGGEGNGAVVDGVRGGSVAPVTDQGELGFGDARGQVGDANAGAEEVTAQVVRELLDEGLAGAIDVASGVGPLAGGGADVDDVGAGAGFDEGWEQGVGDVDHTGDVGVDHGVQVGQCHLLHGGGGQGEAGVVDQGMDPAELGGQRLHRLADGFGVLHIQFQGMNGHQGAQFVSQGIQAFQAAPADDHGPAVPGEATGGGGAEARGSTGNKQDLAQRSLLSLV